MNDDAADIHRATLARRPAARTCLFVLAMLAGALIGVTVARSVTPHSAIARAWRPIPAQLVPPGGSAPASFADVVAVVRPAVIGVQTKMVDSSEQRAFASPKRGGRSLRAPGEPTLSPRQRPGRLVTTQGSGFFISADGYAVTNNHVVDGGSTVHVETDDRRTYVARVIGADPTTDLALIKVDGRNDFAYVMLAEAAPRVGDWVLAVGNPFGLGGTVTAGIVSARERDIGADSSDRLLQIDAPINKGDSGGPSFGLDGKVIGVNTMIFSPSGGSIGIAFAIPAETVKAVIPQLKDKGSVTRGWLGAQAQPVTPEIAESLGLKEARGALVAEPEPDSPATEAGIAPGDVIASLDGKPVNDARDLSRTVAATAPGTVLRLGVLRHGQPTNLTVTFGQLPTKGQATASAGSPPGDPETNGRGSAQTDPAASPSRDLGLRVASAQSIPGIAENGVVVTSVEPEGAAAEQGVEIGDVIVEANGRAVKTPSELQAGVSEAQHNGRRSVLLRLKSGDTMRFVAIPAQ